MIRNIVFDVGKVLIGWDPRVSMEMAGITVEDQDALMRILFTDKRIWNEEDRGVKSRQEMADFLVSLAPEYESQIRLFHENATLSATPMPYSRDWITSLKTAGFKVYVLSNFGEEACRRAINMGAINFMDLLDGYIYSYMVHYVKPEPEIYQALFDKYNLIPEECVFIDDVESNVEAARSMGMQGLVFTDYESGAGQLEEMLRS